MNFAVCKKVDESIKILIESINTKMNKLHICTSIQTGTCSMVYNCGGRGGGEGAETCQESGWSKQRNLDTFLFT